MKRLLFIAVLSAVLAGSATAAGLQWSQGGTSQNVRLVNKRVHQIALRAGLPLARCCRGPRGPRGPRGFPGPPGRFTTANIQYVRGPVVTMCPASGGGCSVQASEATCPSGVAIAGGWSSTGVRMSVPASGPTTGGRGWLAIGVNETDFQAPTIQAIAICARS